MYILAQIIGVLAVATFLLSYQMKKRKNIIRVNTAANILFVINYALLGAFEGAATDVLATISSITAYKKDNPFIKKYFIVIMCIINLGIIAIGALLYKDVYSLFPIAGSLLQTSALWINGEKKIRIVSFLGTPCWIVYNLSCEAYGPAVGSALIMISIIVAIYRYDIKKMPEPEKE